MCVCVSVRAWVRACAYVLTIYVPFGAYRKWHQNKSDSSTNKVWSDKSWKSEENYWADFQNWVIFTRLACSKPHKMLPLETETQMLFTFAGLGCFCFYFSKKKKKIWFWPKNQNKQGKEASEFPCRDKRDIVSLRLEETWHPRIFFME